MFKYLSDYRVVLVTGPQRAGTRIAAKMIAHDTGLTYIDERAIDTDSLYRLSDAIHLGGVVQCPAMCRFIHMFGQNEGLAIVMMMRVVEDIIASQKRIGWHWEPIELAYYETQGVISEVKYHYWLKQKPMILHPYEVEYESLSEHPLWLPSEERLAFAHDQTE